MASGKHDPQLKKTLQSVLGIVGSDTTSAGVVIPNVCRVDRELLRGEKGDMNSWRIFKILAEFVTGFDVLRKYSLAASIFGSARIPEDHPDYESARRLGKKLAEAGFAVITGGGKGVMEAANRGAMEAGGHSIGLNIELPNEQQLNRYVTDSAHFHHFYVRKVMLVFSSEVYFYMPGGIGTLNEFYELITLLQTGKTKSVPIYLIGRSYWEPLVSWMRTELLESRRVIDAEDLDLFTITDTVDEAYDLAMQKLCS